MSAIDNDDGFGAEDGDDLDQLSPELLELNALLLALPDDDDALILTQADGLIAGTLIWREPIPPAEWLHLLWGNDGPAFPDDAKSSALIETLALRRRTEVAGELLRGGMIYAPVYDVDPVSEAPLWEIWIEGFARAVDLRRDEWTALLETDDEDMGAAALGLSMFIAVTEGVKLPRRERKALEESAPDVIPYLVEVLYRGHRNLPRIIME